MMDGKRLQELITTLGWSPDQAADLTGKTKNQWYNYEHGRTAIPEQLATYIETMAQRKKYPHVKQATAQHLKVFRERLDLTQAEAASLVGTTRVTWNRWEQGRAVIPVHMYFTLRGVVLEMRKTES